MNLTVSQRIVLTMAVTLVLFLATSLVGYQRFDAVSTQVGSVIRDASPWVYIGASLRANLAGNGTDRRILGRKSNTASSSRAGSGYL